MNHQPRLATTPPHRSHSFRAPLARGADDRRVVRQRVGWRAIRAHQSRPVARAVCLAPWRFLRERRRDRANCPAGRCTQSLRAIVKPVAAKGREHFEMAVRYAARFGGRVPNAPAGDADARRSALFDRLRQASRRQRDAPGKKPSKMPPHIREKLKKKKEQDELLAAYAAEHPDVVRFTTELVRLHRAMLRYYVQMRYLTPVAAETLGQRRHTVADSSEAHAAAPGRTGRSSVPLGFAARRSVWCALEHVRAQHSPSARLPRAHRAFSDAESPPPKGARSPQKLEDSTLDRTSRPASYWTANARGSWSMTGRSHPCWRAFTSRRCIRSSSAWPCSRRRCQR